MAKILSLKFRITIRTNSFVNSLFNNKLGHFFNTSKMFSTDKESERQGVKIITFCQFCRFQISFLILDVNKRQVTEAYKTKDKDRQQFPIKFIYEFVFKQIVFPRLTILSKVFQLNGGIIFGASLVYLQLIKKTI